jgi:hypothetical protein
VLASDFFLFCALTVPNRKDACVCKNLKHFKQDRGAIEGRGQTYMTVEIFCSPALNLPLDIGAIAGRDIFSRKRDRDICDQFGMSGYRWHIPHLLSSSTMNAGERSSLHFRFNSGRWGPVLLSLWISGPLKLLTPPPPPSSSREGR